MFGDDIADRSGTRKPAVPQFGHSGGAAAGTGGLPGSGTTVPPGQLQFGAFAGKSQGGTTQFQTSHGSGMASASPTQPFRGRGISDSANAPKSPDGNVYADESGSSGQGAHIGGRRLFGAGGADSAGSAGELDGWQSLGAADGTGPSTAEPSNSYSGAMGGSNAAPGQGDGTSQQYDQAGSMFGGMFGGSTGSGQAGEEEQQQQPGGGAPGGPSSWWPFGRRSGVVPALGYDPDVPGHGEKSLLAELEIDFEEVGRKTMTVLMPWNRIAEAERTVVAGGDVIGPLLVGLALGFVLLFEAKLHFGYIYGFGVVGCLSLYVVLNLMSRTEEGVGIGQVLSIFGYSLIPIVFLALLCLVIPSHSLPGALLGMVCVGWSTWAATRLLEVVMRAREQRYLLAYPSFLLYATFALITLF